MGRSSRAKNKKTKNKRDRRPQTESKLGKVGKHQPLAAKPSKDNGDKASTVRRGKLLRLPPAASTAGSGVSSTVVDNEAIARQPSGGAGGRSGGKTASPKSASINDDPTAGRSETSSATSPTSGANKPSTPAERRHALASICTDVLRQVSKGTPLIIPTWQCSSLRPPTLLALAADCSPAAAATYSKSSRGSLIKELVATAEAELSYGSVLANLACVHLGM
jgi:hypothetical protein